MLDKDLFDSRQREPTPAGILKSRKNVKITYQVKERNHERNEDHHRNQ